MRQHSTARLAVYSVDPPAVDAFHAFDADSLVVISAVTDALVHLDAEGEVRPGLAVSWERVTPLAIELELRRGVQFHNGEEFDADTVIANLRAHLDPVLGPTHLGALIFAPIAACARIDRFRVRIETTLPDAMLLRRLAFSYMYPRGLLEAHGRDHFATKPVGTGAYRLARWDRGWKIVLARNVDHWAQRATIDQIRLPIIPHKQWIDGLARGEIDIAWNIDAHDAVRASRLDGIQARSREAAISQQFLIANRGPLADVRVRRALNHAISRRLTVDIAEHGMGRPQHGVATTAQQGHDPDVPVFRYSPELAARLLAEAGHAGGFRLRGLVSDTSSSVYFLAKEFLSRLGVHLDAEIVPRSEIFKSLHSRDAPGKAVHDFVVMSAENPILHPLFGHATLLRSDAPCSLTEHPGYDRLFAHAVTQLDEPAATEAQRALDRFAHDEALMLFTVQQHAHAAWREGFGVVLPRSGHFSATAFWDLECPDEKPAEVSVGHDASTPGAAPNLDSSEARWHLQAEPMVRELVRNVETRNHLTNVLDSTDRVAIAGYSKEGRRLFVNSGYERMFGPAGGAPVHELLAGVDNRPWDAIRAQVDSAGSWTGPLHLPAAGRPLGAPTRLYLAVAPALDEELAAIGYTFVFSDFSGEEERIRHQAIRTILDNVPYGLLMCDREGKAMDGYSRACARFFATTGEIQGQPLVALLGLDPGAARHFQDCYEQVIEDFLPEELNLDQIPARLQIGERHVLIRGSLIRADDGSVLSVLFTLLDISELIEAEREVERTRGVLQVLRYRARFEEYVRDLDGALERLAVAEPGPAREAWARRELHTAKGVFAQFGLSELARGIHAIEDQGVISTAALEGVRSAVRALLEANAPFWGITLEATSARHTVTEAMLARIEAQLAGAGSAEQARSIVAAAFTEIREKTVAELMAPLCESCSDHAARSGKAVRVELGGAEVRCPLKLAPIFAAIPHALRNSVDHGLEAPDERGEKPAVATIRIESRRSDLEFALTISDDGRGIDVEKVAAAAVAKGLVTAREVAGMSREERVELVFLAGLSTSTAVSETSGRGVGMSAVKEATESLGGVFELTTCAGKGTRMTLRFAHAAP